MGIWKVLGGAAAGVAAVAALPVAGPIGAVTLAGAAVAGTLGAGAGAVAEALDDSEERAERRGEKKAKAQYKVEIEKLTNNMEVMLNKMKDTNQLYQAIYAMEAVAIAVAKCDGEFHPKEKEQIDEFIAGVASGSLPQEVKDNIQNLYLNPPNIKEAYKMVKDSSIQDMDVIDDIINVTINADDVIHDKEVAFMEAWDELKKRDIA